MDNAPTPSHASSRARPPARWFPVVLIAMAGVLLAAVTLQIVAGARTPNETAPAAPLRTLLPGALAGWTAEDRQIAATEEMKKAVGELLNFDDGAVRVYRQGRTEVEVYVAYWRPGKMSHRLVAGHTPDVCWVQAGWKREEAHPYVCVLDGGQLKPAQFRVFLEPRGVRREVLFWHLAGDELVDYSSAGSPPWWAALSDLKRYGLEQRRSQYFVRLATNGRWQDLEKDPGYRELLRGLANVGLLEPKR